MAQRLLELMARFFGVIDWRIPEHLAAALLACGFAMIGRLVAGNRGRRRLASVSSFLAGLGVVGLAFFPLSRVIGASALNLTTLVVSAFGVAFVALAAVRSIRRFRAGVPAPQFRHIFLSWDWQSRTATAIIALFLLQFAIFNLRMSYVWDGFQIWATKALILYERGEVTRDFLVPDRREFLAGYPHLIPLYEAMLNKLVGRFEWHSLKPVFLVFFVCLLVSVYRLSRNLLPAGYALIATAIVASLPAVATGYSTGGYADMPLAAFATAGAACLSEPKARGRPFCWIIAGMLFVKSEATILALIFVAAIAVFWALAGRNRVSRGAREHWPAIIVIACALAVRQWELRWTEAVSLTYGPLDAAHFRRAAELIWHVPQLCASYAFSIADWGLLWPAFLIAAPLLLLIGSRLERTLAAASCAALGAYMSIFYFTNWPVHLHIDQAIMRLLTHVAPIATVLVVCGWLRLNGAEAAKHGNPQPGGTDSRIAVGEALLDRPRENAGPSN